MAAENDPLLEYLRRPDKSCLERVVHAYHGLVWEVAFRITGNREDAADICQDVFLKLLLEPPDPRGIHSPAGYLAWRAIGRAHFLRRAGERRKAREKEFLERLGAPGIGGEDVERIHETIAALPEELRFAVELHYLADIPADRIAEMLGISERALYSRLEKAREVLKRRLALSGFLVFLSVEGVPSQVPPPPQELLPGLLQIVRMGSALAPSSGYAGASSLLKFGAIFMGGKKIAISLTLAILILLGGIAYFSIRTGGGGGQAGPPAASPAASTPVLAKKARLGSESAGSTEAKSEAPNAVGPASIAGRIVSEGRGLEGAKVLAVNTASWQAIIEEKERDPETRWDSAARLERMREGLLGMAKTVPATSSEANGSFRFPSLPDGTYRLLAAREGFLPSTGNLVQVVPGATARVVIELVPALFIAGKVVDPSGAPIPGAAVEAESRERAALLGSEKIDRQKDDLIEGEILVEASPASSAADGSFRLDSLEPALHDLTARKEGFLEGRAYQVAAGSRDVVLTLQPGRSVLGRVLGPDRSPLGGAEVKVASAGETEVHRLFSPGLLKLDASRRKARVRTGDDGRFRVTGLEPGSFVLLVGVEGLPPLEKEIALAEADLDLGDLALEAPRTIAGTVRTPDGKPFTDARVWIPKPRREVRPWGVVVHESREAVVEARSGPDGRFAISGLPAGTFELRASAEGFAPAVAKGVQAGASDVALTLEVGFSIPGKVVDGETSEPVAGAEVMVGADEELRATTDARGTFLIRGLPFSSLHNSMTYVFVHHPEYDPYTDLNAFVLGRDERSPLILSLSRGDRVSGAVRDSSGRPVLGAKVWIESIGLPAQAVWDPAQGIRSMSGKDGAFVLAAPTGLRGMYGEIRFFVLASHPISGYGRAGPFPIPGTGEAWPQVDLLLSGSTIEGKAMDEEGKPVPHARVAASPAIDPGDDRWPAGGRASGPTACSGPDGSFRLAGVERGPVVIVATALGFAPRKIAGLVAGEDPLRLDIVLSRGGAVEGRVHGSGGEPIAQAEVIALPEEKEEDPGPLGITEFARRMSVLKAPGLLSARTGPDGDFRLEHMPEGTFYIAARAPGYEAAVAPSVRSGASGVELVLERFSAVGGTVLASDTRKPITRFTVDILDLKKLQAGREKNRSATESGIQLPPFHYREASEGKVAFDHPAGRFLYDGLRPGDYTVLIQAEGYLNATRDVSLKGGEETSVEILFDGGMGIDGIVLDKENGVPVARAEIEIWYPRTREEELMTYSQKVLTQADGTFSVSGLREGKCVLAIEHPYYLKEQAVAVELPCQEDRPLEIRLEPGGRLEGRIRGSKSVGRGKKFVSYSLEVKRLREDPESQSRRKPEDTGVRLPIDHDGRYWAGALRPGFYFIEMRKQLVEISDVRPQGPDGGTASYEPIGPEERIFTDEIELRARETTIFNATIPPHPGEPGR